MVEVLAEMLNSGQEWISKMEEVVMTNATSATDQVTLPESVKLTKTVATNAINSVTLQKNVTKILTQ
ncbi:hypothetical protein RRG08_056367, partial [Elysia crispata]